MSPRIPPNLMSGLKASDALEVREVKCKHASWNLLNKEFGCIHRDHGPYPPTRTDTHSGMREVRGVPTRFLPRGDVG